MSKPSLTFLPVFALTSIKGRLNFRDKASPYSVDTSLSPSRSSFVAIRTLLTSEGAWLSICVIHFSIFSKEDRSVILQVRMMPTAPLQYACVIFLNLYWPAVSQICNLYLRLPQQIVLILKSTPMVATYESLKLFSQNLVMRLVLPTPLSPMMITFAMKSYLSFFFASYINYNITTPAYGPTLSQKALKNEQLEGMCLSCADKRIINKMMIRRIAIYGGAFDPPHIGHIKLIQHLANMQGIDQVWLMPCGDRDDKKLLLSKNTRFQLMRNLFKPYPQIHISEEEINLSKALQKPIHTYDLLKELKAKYQDAKFYFVFGGDILQTLHLWGNWEKLLEENAFIVFYRKGYDFLHQKLPKDSKIVEVDLPQISSSAIKKEIGCDKNGKEKESVLRNWVSDQVIKVLKEQKLI